MSEKRMVYAEDVIQRIRDLAPEAPGAHRLAKYQVWHGAGGNHPAAPKLALCGG